MTRFVIVAVAILLAVGCSADVESTTSDPSPSVSTTPSSDAILGTVDIGDGVEVNVKCTGSGEPTVVLESGDESGIQQWGQVTTAISQQTRVCSYDRLGVGASDEATGCRSLPDLLAVLDGWLGALEVPGPYVMVGTSGGGYIAAGYAYAHPEDVVGLVLLDTFRAIDPATAPPDLIPQLACDAPANVERRDYVAVEAEAWNGRTSLGTIPVVVVTMDYSGIANANADEQTNVEEQKGWLVLSSDSRQIIVDSGHNVPVTEPGLVADEILAVVEAARAG